MLTPKEGASSSTVWAHSIEYSALFDGTDDYLSYTPPVTDNPARWTFSAWVKGVPEGGNPKTVFCATQGAGNTGDNNTGIKVTATRAISVNKWASNASQFDWLSSDGLLSDATGWYHVIVVYDATLAEAADRIRVYVNGVRVVPASFTAPALNLVTDFGHSGARHIISGAEVAGRLWPFNGYLVEPRLILGQALEVAALGAFSSRVSGLWTPKEYTGSYGTNGFYLDFMDAADLGRDVSGNGNGFTMEGAPVQATDTPTNNGLTWNPLNHQLGTFGEGNKYVYVHAGADGNAWGTLSIESGKYCFGIIFGNATANKGSIGLRPTNKNAVSYNSDLEGYVQWLRLNGVISSSTGDSAVLAPVTGTVYVFAVDADNGLFSIYADDGATLLADVTITPGLSWTPHCMTNANDVGMWSILVDPSEYIAPEGYLPLCAANLPDPQILDHSTVVDIFQRVGTGEAGAVGSLKFQPDMVVNKRLDAVGSWGVIDRERGSGNNLYMDLDIAPVQDENRLNSITPDGYTFGSEPQVNALGGTFLDWCIKTGPHGFDVIRVQADGNGAYNVPHSLGKTPTIVIEKTIGGTGSWPVWHHALPNYVTFLDLSQAAQSLPGWMVPSATHIARSTLPANAEVMLYVFTDSEVFRAFDYIGNGSANGPYVYLGGRPMFIPFHRTGNAVREWCFHNSVTDPFNPVDDLLLPSNNAAQYTNHYDNGLIATSTGFKVADDELAVNGNGHHLFGLAVIESVTKYSNAY